MPLLLPQGPLEIRISDKQEQVFAHQDVGGSRYLLTRHVGGSRYLLYVGYHSPGARHVTRQMAILYWHALGMPLFPGAISPSPPPGNYCMYLLSCPSQSSLDLISYEQNLWPLKEQDKPIIGSGWAISKNKLSVSQVVNMLAACWV